MFLPRKTGLRPCRSSDSARKECTAIHKFAVSAPFFNSHRELLAMLSQADTWDLGEREMKQLGFQGQGGSGGI